MNNLTSEIHNKRIKISKLLNKKINTELADLEMPNARFYAKVEETDNFITLLSNGEELGLTMDVSDNLNAQGFDTRIVSMPCKKNYKENNVIPKDKTVAITYGVKDYFYKFTDKVIGMDSFGISAKKEDILNHFGYNVEEVTNKILNLIDNK